MLSSFFSSLHCYMSSLWAALQTQDYLHNFLQDFQSQLLCNLICLKSSTEWLLTVNTQISQFPIQMQKNIISSQIKLFSWQIWSEIRAPSNNTQCDTKWYILTLKVLSCGGQWAFHSSSHHPALEGCPLNVLISCISALLERCPLGGNIVPYHELFQRPACLSIHVNFL